MSAADSVNPVQLGMFYTARELMGTAHQEGGTSGVAKFLPGDLRRTPDGGSETVAQGWARKAQTARSERFHYPNKTLTESISEGGVERPVKLWAGGDRTIEHDGQTFTMQKDAPMGAILNGHHRIAGAFDVDPDRLVPVTWASGNVSMAGTDSRIDPHHRTTSRSDARIERLKKGLGL